MPRKRLVRCKQVILIPGTEIIVPTKCVGDIPASESWRNIETCLGNISQRRFLTAKALVDLSQGFFPVRLLNVSHKPQVNKRSTTIVQFEPVSLVAFDAEKDSVEGGSEIEFLEFFQCNAVHLKIEQ